MIDIQNINGYGIEDPGFALLREVAQKYCPEELQVERKEVIPDDALDLSSLASLFQSFLGSGLETPSSGVTNLPSRSGGGGLHLESLDQGLSTLHYEEADTLNSEQIKRDFPVLNQKVNGHDLVWLDNGATT